MLTLAFRPLKPASVAKPLEDVFREVTALFSDLCGSKMIGTMTPVLQGDQTVAHYLRWQTYGTRDRLVIESTWHQNHFVLIDATRAALPLDLYAAIWTLSVQAGQAGYQWLGAWWNGVQDEVLSELFFKDSGAYFLDEEPVPPGRQELQDSLVLEWLRPSPRIMSRLIYFGADCKIDWEGWIVEDLMREGPATYLELRQGKETVALARVLRLVYLPGMEGYDPRRRNPPVEYEIESLEVHPDFGGKGYGRILVEAVKSLRRPVCTLDTYRRAEPFWERMGFVRNARRSAREDSNIFELHPTLGKPLTIAVPGS